jgi:hypothetical protein
MRVRLRSLVSLLGAAMACGAQADPVNWADWISGTAGANGSATGTFNTAGGPVSISYTGQIAFLQNGTSGDMTNYFNPATPYLSALVDNAPPAAEMIALSTATPKTLTFSKPVDNLFFAVVSLNRNGYDFNQDFDIVSSGCGFWGCGGWNKVDLGNGHFEININPALGPEPHGVIRFKGAVSSITWTSLSDEFWNGFTVGTYGIAAVPIPEPSTYALMLLGLGGLVAAARRRRR